MSGHHDKFGRLTQRRALQAASGALRAFRDDLTTSHKGMGWTPRAVVNAHRDELATVCEELGPIVEQRLAREVALDALDRAEKAEAAVRPAYGNTPGARIGGPAVPARGPAAELDSFKSEVDGILATSPDSETARRRVQQLLAIEATRLSFRR
jgi:hypothetical protein